MHLDAPMDSAINQMYGTEIGLYSIIVQYLQAQLFSSMNFPTKKENPKESI